VPIRRRCACLFYSLSLDVRNVGLLKKFLGLLLVLSLLALHYYVPSCGQALPTTGSRDVKSREPVVSVKTFLQPIAADEPIVPATFPPLPGLDLPPDSGARNDKAGDTAKSIPRVRPSSGSTSNVFLEPIAADEPIPPAGLPPLPESLDLSVARE